MRRQIGRGAHAPPRAALGASPKACWGDHGQAANCELPLYDPGGAPESTREARVLPKRLAKRSVSLPAVSHTHDDDDHFVVEDFVNDPVVALAESVTLLAG